MIDAIIIGLLVISLCLLYANMLKEFKRINMKISCLWSMAYEIQNDIGRIEEISEDLETILFYQREIKDYMTYQTMEESEVPK